jgi:hypothetical protein
VCAVWNGVVHALDSKAAAWYLWPCIVRIWQRQPKHRHGQSTQEASEVPSLVNPEPLQKGKSGGYFTYPQQREADPAKSTQVRNT